MRAKLCPSPGNVTRQYHPSKTAWSTLEMDQLPHRSALCACSKRVKGGVLGRLTAAGGAIVVVSRVRRGGRAATGCASIESPTLYHVAAGSVGLADSKIAADCQPSECARHPLKAAHPGVVHKSSAVHAFMLFLYCVVQRLVFNRQRHVRLVQSSLLHTLITQSSFNSQGQIRCWA